MTDLSTTYLGMTLRTPLIPSASPLSEKLDNIKQMEDAGAAAVVLHSLFEEQLDHGHSEVYNPSRFPSQHIDTVDYTPDPASFAKPPDEYLEHIRRAKQAVAIPVIASLNGTSIGGWIEYAREIQQAGADALELNLYYIPADPYTTGTQLERTYVQIVEEVRSVVTIPLAVKLSPFFSNIANMASRFEQAGADGLVLFNRFYQPHIDVDLLQVRPQISLSTSAAVHLPLRWIAILYGRIHTDLAATSGVHEVEDVVKLLMAGASATMLCSALLQKGIGHISVLEEGLREWMKRNEFTSVERLQGILSQDRVADPAAFERAHYIRALQGYKAQKQTGRSDPS